MTALSNIITPWTETPLGILDGTSKYVTTPTTTASTPSWSSVYEITATDGNLSIRSSNTSNNNFTNALTNLNAKTGNELEDNDSEMLRTIEYIGNVLSFYYVPIIVGTGSMGNILSVIVFFKTKLRKLSSSFYLAALAVSDTCFLLGLFAQWLNFVDVHIYNREHFCQFFTFLTNLTCFCSVWFVVAFTVERFIAVMYPLRRQTMCTVKRAKMVLIGLTILGCLHCAPFWISSTPVYSPKLETTICDIKSEYKDYITLLNYWDTIVVFAVPFTAIVILNIFTGCTVWKFATVRRSLTMQKMKTQHVPLHGTVSSPSSSCSVREGSIATTLPTLANTGGTKLATTTIQQEGISSLKRQKATSCANSMYMNGQHNHIVHHPHPHHHHHHNSYHSNQHQQHQHKHQPNQPESQYIHSHPNRATIIKQSPAGNNDFADVLLRKSRRKQVTNSSQLKVTKMLLIVSTVFVCLNLPSFIMRMITYLETQSSANEKTTVVLQYIFQLLFVTNFGINFVLYCVSGQNFRKAVLSMFRKVSTTQRDGTTQITVSECYRNSGANAAACSTNTSTRKRPLNQNFWNEMHELQHIK